MPVIFGEHLWILRENVSTYTPPSDVYLLCRPFFEALNGRPGSTSNETLSEAHGGGIEDFLPLFFLGKRGWLIF